MSQLRRPSCFLASLFLAGGHVWPINSRAIVCKQRTRRRLCTIGQGVDHQAGLHEPSGGSPAQSRRDSVAQRRARASHRRTEKLTYYADILKYYRALAAATPRVKVIPIGKSNEGRDLVVVFVGGDESIRNLETYRGYLAQLADPRKLSADQAKEIIAKAKPIYHLSGGLHSGEVGPSEMLMELAYRLATEDSTADQTDPRQRDRVDHAGCRPRRPRSERGLVLQVRHQRNRRSSDRRRRAVLGQVHLSRRQPRHQLLADRNARAARLVPAVAPADHARPASGTNAALHVQRPGAAEPESRSDPLRRAAQRWPTSRWRSSRSTACPASGRTATWTCGRLATSRSCRPTTTA